jgi:hypothetical protein
VEAIFSAGTIWAKDRGGLGKKQGLFWVKNGERS